MVKYEWPSPGDHTLAHLPLLASSDPTLSVPGDRGKDPELHLGSSASCLSEPRLTLVAASPAPSTRRPRSGGADAQPSGACRACALVLAARGGCGWLSLSWKPVFSDSGG